MHLDEIFWPDYSKCVTITVLLCRTVMQAKSAKDCAFAGGVQEVTFFERTMNFLVIGILMISMSH